MTTKELDRLMALAETHADNQAVLDLGFSGDAALEKLPLTPQQRHDLREALRFYARNGAGRALRFYRFHLGHS